jgi:hypothetical protein
MRIAFYKGRKRFFNRFVNWWTQGPYSHCEAVFSHEDQWNPAKPMYCASSSFLDGGVRFKDIVLDPAKWDVIDVPSVDGLLAIDWFHHHLHDGYDLVGLLATSIPVRHGGRRWFCNEAVGAAIGLDDAWRFNPTSFARIVTLLPGSKWIQGGPEQLAPAHLQPT